MEGQGGVESLDIETESGTAPMRGYLRIPQGHAKAPAIIVAHELFGVNADILGVVDRLASLGYVALAPEFYHRYAPAGESLERNDAGRKRGFEYLNRVTRDDVVRDVRAAMNYLAARDDVDGNIGMLGFSAGGHMAFLAATRLDLKATAVLYGGWLIGGDIPLAKPEPTIELSRGIAEHHGRLFYAVGGKDSLIDARQVERIRETLEREGVTSEVVVYPDAEHAFFWEGTPSFDRDARDDAWRRIEKFYARAFSAHS